MNANTCALCGGPCPRWQKVCSNECARKQLDAANAIRPPLITRAVRRASMRKGLGALRQAQGAMDYERARVARLRVGDGNARPNGRRRAIVKPGAESDWRRSAAARRARSASDPSWENREWAVIERARGDLTIKPPTD